ncbi:MAG: Transcriptional regulatory protein BaeR [Paracidovorax wautersii]|uniref:Transcriptional regulatory protein BaeR n=1 Tax=Paracidovorax wautersii TaxID=1177982 RepID=A0A7V8JQ63_9BURK|nr:MAG: Transcriptional regulatory protein BaeR [Paracidovorax wautersii]
MTPDASTAPRTAPADILIVEDEPKMAGLLTDYLVAAGHAPRHLGNGVDVAPAVRRRRPDLVLLDLMLPGQDGLAVCRELRRFCDVPIIMLTARVEEADRLIGLDAGADDYICKMPFSPREVVARVHALLRRTRGGLRVPAEHGRHGLVLDAQAQRARLHGQALDLTPVEYRLLALLAEAPGRVFSRDALLGRLHDDARAVTDRAIDSHVKNLRRKLQAAGLAAMPIHSVYGMGYRFEWPEET